MNRHKLKIKAHRLALMSAKNKEDEVEVAKLEKQYYEKLTMRTKRKMEKEYDE